LRSSTTAAVIAVRRGPDHVRSARGSGPLATALGVDVGAVAATERAGTSAGDLTRVPHGSHQEDLADGADGAAGQVFLLGVGDGSPGALRSAAAVMARSIRGVDLVVTTLAAGSGAEGVAAAAEGVLL